MAARILIVEDEEPLTMLLRYNLEAAGYTVDSAARGDEAELKLRESPPDLVVLDWMLPAVSGIELCRRLRAQPATAKLPIIMLTARGEESERVRGLTTGADDYVVKPFSVSELLARVNALLRRAQPATAKLPIIMLTARGEESERVRGLATGADDYIVKPFSVSELLARINALLRRAKPERVAAILRAGDIELDRERRRVFRAGREITLGPTEFRLLEYLIQSPGRVFSREQLLNGVWGHDVYIEDRTVDVHVGRLRKALSQSGERDPIRTVRGSGYSFDERYQK